jgi:hypothetical protein
MLILYRHGWETFSRQIILQLDLLYCRGSYSLVFFFPLGTKFNITSVITLSMDMSEVIRKKRGSKNLHVLTTTKTGSKTLVPSRVTPIRIHVDSPSTSFQMSAIQPSPSALVSDHGHLGYWRTLVRTNQGEQSIDINCTHWLFGYHFKNRS